MTSRERILSAAIPVFAGKGRHGAHMEEIAALARINKAMIYYIFHNKDELYFEVLKYVLEKAWEFLSPITDENIENERDYTDVLANYITVLLAFFNENRDFTKIIIDSMSSGTEEIHRASNYIKAIHKDKDPMLHMKNLIEKGKTSKAIRDIDTDQLMISMMGMVLIYFLSYSIKDGFDIEVKDEAGFMEIRRKSVIDLVLNGILAGK